MSKRVTVPELRARKQQGPKIAMLTAYDATMARLLDEAGADVLLVGDSLGMVVQGLTNTLPVTVEEICYHGRAVARGTSRAHLVLDMPFMSFQHSPERALDAAGKLMKEGSGEAVKLEGGEPMAETIRRIVSAGIPVMGHVGLLPQSVHAMGGFRVQGKGEDDALRILKDAQAVEAAGAYAVVLEGLPADVGRRITEALSIPTIGIGAGPACDGQVLVCYDFLGMFDQVRPKFVKHFAELGTEIRRATRAYVEEVQRGSFPAAEHSFGMAAPRQLGESTGAEVAATKPPAYGPADEGS
ncbi:MAG: 3-methyl-2-oxobutanoate hydroxymethyltransferase [Polyangiaceae bacterium]|nr:3-methyl-2-oxobutanoate hydroxymethyltransferase [Polyangiaceae bacterium]MCW5790637.1 3-methyl-2-oxobutanoate hydroxymethyltransferase [Polyangiaceae bacterium]